MPSKTSLKLASEYANKSRAYRKFYNSMNTESTISTYSVTDGISSDIVKNGAVKMAGVTTPRSSGHILDTDVRAKDTDANNVTRVLTNQVVANYPSDGGDSGAPVFITTGSSTAKIIGQHVGKFCKVDLHSGSNYAQWCTNTKTGEGALTVFTPWPSVKSNLGI